MCPHQYFKYCECPGVRLSFISTHWPFFSASLLFVLSCFIDWSPLSFPLTTKTMIVIRFAYHPSTPLAIYPVTSVSHERPEFAFTRIIRRIVNPPWPLHALRLLPSCTFMSFFFFFFYCILFYYQNRWGCCLYISFYSDDSMCLTQHYAIGTYHFLMLLLLFFNIHCIFFKCYSHFLLHGESFFYLWMFLILRNQFITMARHLFNYNLIDLSKRV